MCAPHHHRFTDLAAMLYVVLLLLCVSGVVCDAFTSVRGVSGDISHRTVGRTPTGAYARSLNITSTSQVFTWYSQTPANESEAESAFIIVHGVDRNANTYFRVLNNAWSHARDEGIGSASNNSIRVAPMFFSTTRDRRAYNTSHLAWADFNAWTAGEASTHPRGSGVSSFSVLDAMVRRFSNRRTYPKMKWITFVAHGGGAQMLQRYAVLGMPNPAPARLSVRYVIGDPSSQLYFTPDRPVAVDTTSCPAWNDYRYGTRRYSSDYAALSNRNAADLFRTYAAREVRYIVGLNDTRTDEGDQTCMAHAVGGPKRRNRNLAYWKYINLLAGTGADLRNLPGTFPMLEGKDPQRNVPASTSAGARRFKGAQLRHTLSVVENAGHSATKIYGSVQGRNALFGEQAKSGGGDVPDLAQELVGYTADAKGASNDVPDESDE
ncbi:uncharacterized protein PAN0_008c3615 [Moesziomyces antarcticus]|uniref:Transmembrane protein n=2 Tax=Pseudozyma antarctica TaxID=84753 RepID=A0A081CFF2_PSEA2|nr:uncharacterized protein PAN0_008c3615 [Moesziomyces antarcticus]GAK65398.1 transmembrane protein [Moesziomyces antarcticus]